MERCSFSTVFDSKVSITEYQTRLGFRPDPLSMCNELPRTEDGVFAPPEDGVSPIEGRWGEERAAGGVSIIGGI